MSARHQDETRAGGLHWVLDAVFDNYDMVISILLAVATFTAASAVYAVPTILGDARQYTMAAERLVRDHYFAYDGGSLPSVPVPPDARVTPFHVLFLAGFYMLFGRTGDAISAAQHVQPLIVAFQSLLSLVTVGAIALCGRELGGKRLGLIAGVMAACYLPFIWGASVALAEPLAVPLIAVQLLVALKLTAKRRVPTRRMLFAFGVLSGVVGLTRPSMIAWFAIPLLYLAIYRFREWRRVASLIAVAALGFVLVLSPWWIRNAYVIGRFVPIRTDEIRSANGAYQDIGADSGVAPPANLHEKLAQVSAGMTEPWTAPDDVTWEDHFRSGAQTGINVVPYSDAMNDATHDRLIPWMNVMYIYQLGLLALAAVSLFLCFAVPRLVIVASAPVYLIFVHVNTQIIDRYMFPGMPALIVLAAAGAFGLWRVAARMLKRSPARHLGSTK